MKSGRMKIKEVLETGKSGTEMIVKGWVRTVRVGKNVTFIALNDGSCMTSLQVVVEPDIPGYREICGLGTGSAVAVRGSWRNRPPPARNTNCMCWSLQ